LRMGSGALPQYIMLSKPETGEGTLGRPLASRRRERYLPTKTMSKDGPHEYP